MKYSFAVFTLLIAAFLFAAQAGAVSIPTVTEVSPNNGPAAGGTTVQITGSGFTGTTAINFGTVPVAIYVVNSDTSITATAPESFAAGTIDVSVTTIVGTSPVSSADQYTYIDGNWYAYVSVFNSANSTPVFLPINLTTNTAGTLLTLPTYPQDMAITSNAQLALTISGDLDLVSNVDLATLQALTPITTTEQVFQLAISPNGITGYLTSTFLNNLQPIDIPSGTLGTTIPVPSPNALAITPDGLTAFVSSTSNKVYPVDLNLEVAGAPIQPVPFGEIQITPDGTKAFLNNSVGTSATYIDLTTNPPTPHSLSLGHTTNALAINPNGTTVYFTASDSNNLIHVDIATLTPTVVSISVGADTIAITPDGKTGYLGSFPASEVLPIDLTTYITGNPIILSNGAVIIVISPDQAPIASFTATAAPSGSPTTFDASASYSPVGSIAVYSWDFGDGNTLETALPVVTHTYALSGNYTVTLTVTNTGGTSTTQTYTGQMVSNNGGPSAQTSQLVQISTLFPPQNVQAFQIGNKFLMQEEFRNVIVWEAQTGGVPPVAYNIYADAALTDLLAIVPANGKLEFVQYNVHERPYTYYLISVDAQNGQSVIVSVTAEPRRHHHSSS